jgi:hypothetical protein
MSIHSEWLASKNWWANQSDGVMSYGTVDIPSLSLLDCTSVYSQASLPTQKAPQRTTRRAQGVNVQIEAQSLDLSE